MVLNKKQIMVGWTMLLLVTAIIIRAIYALADNPSFQRVFFCVYFSILILGSLSIYALKDKKK